MGRIASFHLVRERPGRQLLVLARLATDRRRLVDVDGLLFWRLLGTGRGDRTSPGADLRRSALFAVWRDEASLDRFMNSDPIAARWQHSSEAWHVRLRGLGGHGSWGGFDVLDGLEVGAADGAVVILTRARIRRRSWRSFMRAARSVDQALSRAAGLLGVVGIGESPVGRLGTLTVWASLESAREFARSDAAHGQAVTLARSDGWFGEELFARFEPYGASGSWGGGDPLAAIQDR